jgi:hypothetical protein
MSLSRSYQTDSVKEQNGIRIKMAPNDDGSIPTFVISRSSRANPKYLAAAARIMGPYKTLAAKGAIPTATFAKLQRQIFIEGALISWENILKSDVSGNSESDGFADYNETNAETLFERLPELYFELSEKSADLSNYLAEALEADAKN